MKTSKLTVGMILLATGSMFAVTANAAEVPAKEATTKAEASVKGGDLYLTGFTNNVNFNFDLNDAVTTDENGNTTINSIIKSKPMENESGIIQGQVVDLLGSNEKWTVNVKLSEFVNAENKEQKLANPLIEGSKILGQEVPTTKAQDLIIIDQVGVNIVSDNETSGLGVNTIGLSNAMMTFGYTKNKKVVAGDYTGELSWNLVDAETGQE
ncbi:WxL domain-containing protein [Enterococcus quebecensis]|uniref:WxL domain-containing protein n=1 Tax=Enterococcus quebecensis TaxID=903983 RepID=A0A1E5GTL4_9ENTE|nr:WxL domain-containing protein [Enterococcus quebecensis]OEG15640.1 hypothetical protein BCR23_09245 [Enterococcus quebecensis]OJG74574.1 hypothetical protein RV12_GL002329 [Enterococcus quebecensis]